MKTKLIIRAWAATLAAVSGAQAQPALQAGQAVQVTVDNFVRAESDMYAAALVKAGGFGKLFHFRDPAPIDNQTIIRFNRDTLYTTAVFDLDPGPVTITLPDAGKRFMTLQIINQDNYVPAVIYRSGPRTLTRERGGSRYLIIGIRPLVHAAHPKDVEQAHTLQEAIKG